MHGTKSIWLAEDDNKGRSNDDIGTRDRSKDDIDAVGKLRLSDSVTLCQA